MLCIANARRIVLQPRSLVHNTTSSGHFDRAIRRPFLRAKSHTFRCFKIAKHGLNFWNSVFKMLNFQNIEKLVSLHLHFNLLFMQSGFHLSVEK